MQKSIRLSHNNKKIFLQKKCNVLTRPVCLVYALSWLSHYYQPCSFRHATIVNEIIISARRYLETTTDEQTIRAASLINIQSTNIVIVYYQAFRSDYCPLSEHSYLIIKHNNIIFFYVVYYETRPNRLDDRDSMCHSTFLLYYSLLFHYYNKSFDNLFTTVDIICIIIF